MNIKFLLLGTSLSFIPTLSFAQCVETTNCETLGYTETSCNGDKGVKCPFGNKWFCFETEEEFKTRLCPELGFTLDCSGENQTGSNYTCNGKYNYCDCSDGYGWKNGKCERTNQIQNGAQGDLYYCNGIVVAVKTSGMNFYIGMNDHGTMEWGGAYNSCRNYRFCGTTFGAMPSITQLQTIYQNKSGLNALLTANGGEAINEKDDYWSTDGRGQYMKIMDMSNGNIDESPNYSNQPTVRPVLTSW